MLWVEQPVGVGYTQGWSAQSDAAYMSRGRQKTQSNKLTGLPNIVDEVQLGKEFVGFYQQFVKAFGIQG